MRHLCFFALLLLVIQPSAWARLGETEQQSQARYGQPAPELASPLDKPLLNGAKEVIYKFSDYRVRAAFVNNVTVRIEYIHLSEKSVVQQLQEPEVKAILGAEKGTFTWREDKLRSTRRNPYLFGTIIDGQKWERSDHALATLKLDIVLLLEAKDAEAIEKKLSKAAPAGVTATPTIPKF